MSNQYSQSQQDFYQQPNQQQQWMAYQQQQQNPSSVNNLMAGNQQQWQEHIANNNGSAINLNQQNNYAMWQKQYQSQGNNAYSDMNIQNYQTMQQQQQAYIAMQQQQAMMAQMQQQQIAQSQRALFQQQARNNVNNIYASTGQIPNTGYNQRASNANPNFLSQNAIYDRKMGKLEEDEEMDHETFVPPAPQSQQEIEKYVNWQAKRKGIDEQKKIDAQIEVRKQMSAMNTEKETKMEFKSVKKNSYTEPLLSDRHKDSDIDYECLDQQQEKSGCCCVVM